ncbi:MAG: hypothetical protein RL518_1714 [Pseudomonadota bacterium]|jgi:hypothetical protein
MMMKRGKIRMVGAAEGSGKSALQDALALELGQGWIVVEHDDVFIPERRAKTAELAGVGQNSHEFGQRRNVSRPLAFQSVLKGLCDRGLNVIGMGRFHNIFRERNGVPLWIKMYKEDFRGYDFDLLYFLVVPENGDSWRLSGSELGIVRSSGQQSTDGADRVEQAIRRRLAAREQTSSRQSETSRRSGFYRKQIAPVVHSHKEFGLPVCSYPLVTSPQEFAKTLAYVVKR